MGSAYDRVDNNGASRNIPYFRFMVLFAFCLSLLRVHSHSTIKYTPTRPMRYVVFSTYLTGTLLATYCMLEKAATAPCLYSQAIGLQP